MAQVLAHTRLGELLVQHGAISALAVAQALQRQAELPLPLGRLLQHHAQLSEHALLRVLAHQHGMHWCGATAPVPPAQAQPLAQPHDSSHYLRHHTLPLWRDDAGVHLLTCWPLASVQPWFAARYPHETLHWYVVDAATFRAQLTTELGTHLVQQASEKVVQLGAQHSARETLLHFQRHSVWYVALLITAAALLGKSWSILALWGVLHATLAAIIAFKLWLVLAGWRHQPAITQLEGWRTQAWQQQPLASLPTYTVLVPLYDEAAVVPRLLGRLAQLDYPPELLDIKLIVEADDDATQAALTHTALPAHYDVVRVPPSQPRTKPKVCNYALAMARGSLITIFDAEDAPHPQQLRMAAWAFAQLPSTVACLQASLNYYNASANWLTRWFALEYGMWFLVLLGGLERGGFPIPLGGTSNHFRRFALEHVGGWDAYNVTEDADLGMRLSRFGYQTRLLPSHTLEEAPTTLGVWIRQRTRWIKGYMQTWCVHMRQPAAVRWRLGWRQAVGFHLFIGGPCLLHACTPLLIGLSLWHWWHQLPWNAPSAWGLLAASAALHVGLGLAIYPRLARLVGLPPHPTACWWLSMLCFPLYWVLHAVASLRAAVQLVRTPHRWEKSPHGISQPPQNIS